MKVAASKEDEEEHIEQQDVSDLDEDGVVCMYSFTIILLIEIYLHDKT